jgi:hypothetical protein
VVGRLLGLLALSVHDAGWFIIFFASVIGVLVALLVIATLTAIFNIRPETQEIRYKVFRDLLDLFRRKQP